MPYPSALLVVVSVSLDLLLLLASYLVNQNGADNWYYVWAGLQSDGSSVASTSSNFSSVHVKVIQTTSSRSLESFSDSNNRSPSTWDDALKSLAPFKDAAKHTFPVIFTTVSQCTGAPTKEQMADGVLFPQSATFHWTRALGILRSRVLGAW